MSSVLIPPIIVTIVTMIVFPILTESNMDGLYVTYSVVILLTSVAVMLLNMCIGLLSATQSQAQINGLPITFIVALLPMFSGIKDSLKKVVDCSFMGAYTNFFTDSEFSISDTSIKILLIWNIGLSLLAFLAIKKSKSIELKRKYTLSSLKFFLVK